MEAIKIRLFRYLRDMVGSLYDTPHEMLKV